MLNTQPSENAIADGGPKPSNRIRVLFVEDDDDCREALSADLGDQGFAIQSFRDGRSLLEDITASSEADVILLDWNLPDMQGIDLVLELSHRGITLPVVFLTGHALGTKHEMLAFDRGAIDFIDKARGVPVLVKRLRLIAGLGRRQPKIDAEAIVQRGRLTLRPLICRAYWDGRDVDLTLTEYNVVALLASNPGRFASYRQIYDRMHYEGFLAGCGEDGYRTNVRSSIKRIRHKFREIDSAFFEIENHPSTGYRWRPSHNPPLAPTRPQLSRNDDVDVELNEHVRHRKAGDDQAGAAGGDAAQVACDGVVDRFAVRTVK
jgi:two-component system response regulator ChvI